MTLKRLMLLSVATVALASAAVSEAASLSKSSEVERGIGFGWGPGPGRGPSGPGYNRGTQVSGYVGRWMQNEELGLRNFLNLDRDYRGYEVEAVEVEVHQSGPRAEVNLLINGSVEDSTFSPQGRIVLRPRSRAQLGRDIQTLRLAVRGNAYIGNVTVHLDNRDGGYNPGPGPRPTPPPPPPNYGREEYLQLPVYQRMIGVQRLELGHYIDMYRYRGYRVVRVEVTAQAIYNNALLDVQIRGQNIAPTIYVDPYVRTFQAPAAFNAIVGQGGEWISILNRGDVDIRGVTVVLSAR